jgi:hypothetical protein
LEGSRRHARGGHRAGSRHRRRAVGSRLERLRWRGFRCASKHAAARRCAHACGRTQKPAAAQIGLDRRDRYGSRSASRLLLSLATCRRRPTNKKGLSVCRSSRRREGRESLRCAPSRSTGAYACETLIDGHRAR